MQEYNSVISTIKINFCSKVEVVVQFLGDENVVYLIVLIEYFLVLCFSCSF